MKIQILKNHEASINGITTQTYKADEIIELGSPRLTTYLFNWYQKNPGFAAIYIENNENEQKKDSDIIILDQKAVHEEQIDNKAIQAKQIENKSSSKERRKSSFNLIKK